MKMTISMESSKKVFYYNGLKGFVLINGKSLSQQGKDISFTYRYAEQTDTLYFWTETGFWKVFWMEQEGYVLYHLNNYNPDKSFGALTHGQFHRQKDVKPTFTVMQLVTYICKHDRAKKIIADNYRQLPKSSRKLRKYYYAAQYRERKREARRLDDIFAELEKVSG